MKKRKLDLRSLELDDSLEILDLTELQVSIMGGSTSNDCIFNVYNYLDGNSYDYNQYFYGTFYMLGYTPDVSGGVRTSDIETVGGFGGMNVVDLHGGSGGLSISSSTGQVIGGSYNDYRVMMTFPGAADDAGHAVVVTGTEVVDGKTLLLYHDPTTGKDGFRENGDYISLYGVGAVGTATPYLGGS